MSNGELQFRRPDGRLLPDAPPPADVPANAEGVLRAQHEAARLRLNARTLRSSWEGERFDVAHAIDVLHPLAMRSSERTYV